MFGLTVVGRPLGSGPGLTLGLREDALEQGVFRGEVGTTWLLNEGDMYGSVITGVAAPGGSGVCTGQCAQ